MKYFENILFCDFGRFWSSCCLSLGHVARGFPLSLLRAESASQNAIEFHWNSSSRSAQQSVPKPTQNPKKSIYRTHLKVFSEGDYIGLREKT